MIGALISSLICYGITVTALAIRLRKEADTAIADAQWWEKCSTHDGDLN